MKNMRWYDYITLNLFWLGLNIRNTALGSIFMPYLVGLFAPEAIKNSALGGMRAAGLVIAMLVQPAAGLLSDRSTSRFGRRRPYILVGALLDLVFLTVIALSRDYWTLLLGVLLIQFSSNISHGPLQALIPDLVPENQRGRASAVKSLLELLPLVLVGLTIAKLVGAGQLGWAFFATGASLLVVAVIAMLTVKEVPLTEKPTAPFWPPMLRVLGMLAGIVIGALAGLVAGGLLGGLAGLIALPFADKSTALAVGVGVGGAVAMIGAVIAGVWAGTLATLGQDARRQSSFTWWIVNRLMFLAAATSIQGSVLYLASGWVADRVGHRRLVGVSGLVAAVGGFLLLGTIWVPNLPLVYVAGTFIGVATGLFMTSNWALGTDLVPAAEAGRYLGISNLAGAGAGIVGAGIGGLIADYLNGFHPGLGYFSVFASYAVLFALSAVSLMGVRKK
jgi:MFS family permease